MDRWGPAAGAAGLFRATVHGMNVSGVVWVWRVGVLRPMAEDVAWVEAGESPDWGSGRAAVEAAVTELAAREGRQEYRFELGDAAGSSWPGLNEDGTVDLRDLCSALPEVR